MKITTYPSDNMAKPAIYNVKTPFRNVVKDCLGPRMRQALGLVLALDKNHVGWSTPKSQHREVKTGGWGDQEHPLPHSGLKVSLVHKRLYPRNRIREEIELKATRKKTTERISFGRGLQSVLQHCVEHQWLSPMELFLEDIVRSSLGHTVRLGREKELEELLIRFHYYKSMVRGWEGGGCRERINLDKKESLEVEQWECTETHRDSQGMVLGT